MTDYAAPAYAELQVTSNFSFLRGASHPEELIERAKALGYRALALTDECSFAGAVRAHLAARDAGLPLVFGSEVTLVEGTRLVLLATDRESYGDLSQLITRGRRHVVKGAYRLTRDDVATLGSRCLALWLPALDLRAGDADARMRAEAAFVRDAFAARAWIDVELLGVGRAAQEREIRQAVKLGIGRQHVGRCHTHPIYGIRPALASPRNA